MLGGVEFEVHLQPQLQNFHLDTTHVVAEWIWPPWSSPLLVQFVIWRQKVMDSSGKFVEEYLPLTNSLPCFGLEILNDAI